MNVYYGPLPDKRLYNFSRASTSNKTNLKQQVAAPNVPLSLSLFLRLFSILLEGPSSLRATLQTRGLVLLKPTTLVIFRASSFGWLVMCKIQFLFSCQPIHTSSSCSNTCTRIVVVFSLSLSLSSL